MAIKAPKTGLRQRVEALQSLGSGSLNSSSGTGVHP